MYSEPLIITASTNRNLLQPTKENKRRRKSQIKQIQEDYGRGKHRDDSSSGEPSNTKSRLGVVSNLMRQKSSSSSSSGKSERSQLVDLVVEDHEAENIERVRARKEGGPGWNEVEQKHCVCSACHTSNLASSLIQIQPHLSPRGTRRGSAPGVQPR